MELELKVINEILTDVYKYDIYNPKSKLIKVKEENENEGNKTFYKHSSLPENVLISVLIEINSYGDPKSPEIKFVQPIKKTITSYETI